MAWSHDAHFSAVVAEDPSLVVFRATHPDDRNGRPLRAVVDALLRQHVRSQDVPGGRAAEGLIELGVLGLEEAGVPHYPGRARGVERRRRVRVDVVVWRHRESGKRRPRAASVVREDWSQREDVMLRIGEPLGSPQQPVRILGIHDESRLRVSMAVRRHPDVGAWEDPLAKEKVAKFTHGNPLSSVGD